MDINGQTVADSVKMVIQGWRQVYIESKYVRIFIGNSLTFI